MPVYFMHIHEGQEVIRDDEGRSYPSPETAMSAAISAAREMLAEKIRYGEVVDGQRIEVLDEAGHLVGIVPFRDQVRLADVGSPDEKGFSESLV